MTHIFNTYGSKNREAMINPEEYKIINKKRWDGFGLSNAILLSTGNKKVIIPGHNGEIVPGFIEEDLMPAIKEVIETGRLKYPIIAEIDPTWKCRSINNCGGHCFSALYRKGKSFSIPIKQIEKFIQEFVEGGGKIVRWDGGGEPLLYQWIRNGELIEKCAKYNLKQTILTSGDRLSDANTTSFIDCNVYLRTSLNAATNETHKRFHGCPQPLTEIIKALEKYISKKKNALLHDYTPTGATFLLSHLNYKEVFDCAKLAKEIGIDHFSVRRVLGPKWLRVDNELIIEEELKDLFMKIEQLRSDTFVLFIPWRSVTENDIKAFEIDSDCCWQSIFKTFMEPSIDGKGMNMTLCGRYRGGGIGQLKQIEQTIIDGTNNNYLNSWKYFLQKYDRKRLINTCPSCIDRGFIVFVNNLLKGLNFLGRINFDFQYIHIRDRNVLKYIEVIEDGA